MYTIWKYEIPILDDFEIELPKAAEFLTLQLQFHTLTIWFLVNTDNEMVKRKFRLIGTGHKIIDKSWLKYLGTFQLHDGNFIGHVFEDLTHLRTKQ